MKMCQTINILLLFGIFTLTLGFECGIQQINPNISDPFIIGGQDARPGEFPWHVQIHFPVKKTNSTFQVTSCGGSIISEGWVLTAGHCVINSDNPVDYHVQYNIGNFTEENGVKNMAKVERVILHPDFSMPDPAADSKDFILDNDMALVKFNMNGTKQKFMPICLYNSKVNLTNVCWKIGLGDHGDEKFPDTLQKMNDWVIDPKPCLDLMPHFNATQQLCTGGRLQGGYGQCHGDSGSSYQCLGTDGRYYQLGVISYITSANMKCGQPNSPDVVTNVKHYINWIKTTIEKYT